MAEGKNVETDRCGLKPALGLHDCMLRVPAFRAGALCNHLLAVYDSNSLRNRVIGERTLAGTGQAIAESSRFITRGSRTINNTQNP